MQTIKFQKHYVTNGAIKARVFYSNGPCLKKQADGSRVLTPCVTVYAKDYGGALGKIMPAEYLNGTDLMTDYIEEGHVHLFQGHPLYAAALARCNGGAQ